MGALTHNGEVLQGLPANASQINFDKTGTDLNSTQTENAIKEVNTKANTNANDIDQLKSGLNSKANYQYYDKESSATEDDAIKDLYDSIDIYDKTIVGTLNYHGFWMFMALKYTGASFGSIVLFRFDRAAKFLNVYDGVKTIRSFTFGS